MQEHYFHVESQFVEQARELGLPATVVYLALCQYVFGKFGQRAECWPSLQSLADDTGFDRSTVTRALKVLEAKGWVGRHRGGGRGRVTRYVLKNRCGSAPVPPEETGAETGTSWHLKQVPARTPKKEKEEDEEGAAPPPFVPTPEAIEQVLLSWEEWTQARLNSVLCDSGYRLTEVVCQLFERGQSIWDLNDNRVVVRDRGAFLDLLKAVERAADHLRRRPGGRRLGATVIDLEARRGV